MTEEEKKAIRRFNWINYWMKKFGKEVALISSDSKHIETLLNLIEKLQNENEELKEKNDNNNVYKNLQEDLTSLLKREFIPKDKIREKIENYKNEIECEKSYLEQGIICEEEYKDRVKVYNSYVFILNKLLEEE